MFYNNIVLTLFIFFWSAYSVLAENVCHKMLRELAQNQSAFLQCSTLHAVPVSLCIGCERPYTDMQVTYLTLRNEPNCTRDYFDKDRINVVATTQSILAVLWTKAYCDDCFNSNNSQVFDNKKIDYESCLITNRGHECTLCLRHYLLLNDFYVGLDEKNKGKVCYDLQDAMNRTREHWSKDLKCCHRNFDMLLFLTACSIIAALPIFFYGTTFVLTKRLERNHDMLIEDAPVNRVLRRVNPNSSAADLPSTSSTATCPRVPSPIKNKLNAEEFSNSDDSDFESPPTSKTRSKNE